MARPKLAESLRAAVGAGLALTSTGLLLVYLNEMQVGSREFLLIAPLGATAFLLFAVPNSPLAQPWSAVVGNTVSALVAVCVLRFQLPTEASVGLAVFSAVGAMAILRAMHPPGGAVALAMVLAEEEPGSMALDFALTTVLLDTLILVSIAILYNRMTGRRYPLRQSRAQGRHHTSDLDPQRRLGLSADELANVLNRFNLSANIGAEDFGRILAAAEAEAARHYFNGLICAQIMSRDVVSVSPETPLEDIAELFQRHRFKTLPVTDESGDLLGIITQNDLIQRAYGEAILRRENFSAALLELLDAQREQFFARDIMTPKVRTVAPDDDVGALVQLLADGGVQAAPVTAGKKLVGIVTRSDLLQMLAKRLILMDGSQLPG